MPRLLREHGLVVRGYAEQYQESRITDNEWLATAAVNRWIALSHDDNIRRDKEAVRAVMENQGRLFILRGATTSTDLALMFIDSLAQVRRTIGRHPSFIASVRRSAVKGGLFRSEVFVHLTRADWLARQVRPAEDPARGQGS